jgi:hypothetical protein
MSGADLEQRLAELTSANAGRQMDIGRAWRDLQQRRSRARRYAQRGRIAAGSVLATAVVAAAVAGPVLAGHNPSGPGPRQQVKVSRKVPSYPGAITARIPLRGAGRVVEAGGSAWTITELTTPGAYQLDRIDLRTNAVTLRLTIGDNPLNLGVNPLSGLAAGEGTLWLATQYGQPGAQLVRISPATGRIVQKVHLPAGRCSYLGNAGGRLWADCALAGALSGSTFFVIDPLTGRTEYRSGIIPGAIGPVAVTPSGVWFIGNSSSSSLPLAISGISGFIITRHGLKAVAVSDPSYPADGFGQTESVVYGDGFLWALIVDEVVVKINPATGRVAHVYTYRTYDPSYAGGLNFLTVSHGSMWFLDDAPCQCAVPLNERAPALPDHPVPSGGVLRVSTASGRPVGWVPGVGLQACGEPCFQIYSTAHAIWVPTSGQLLRIDPARMP